MPSPGQETGSPRPSSSNMSPSLRRWGQPGQGGAPPAAGARYRGVGLRVAGRAATGQDTVEESLAAPLPFPKGLAATAAFALACG